MGGMGVLFLGQQHEFEAGLKCKGCDHITTGLAPDHCCWRCMKQPGTHGPHCKKAAPQEMVLDAGMVAEMKDCTRMLKEERKREKELAKCELAGLPCKAEGCVFEASMRACAPGYCCKKCMKGKAEHGKNCAGKVFDELPVPEAPMCDPTVEVQEVVEEVPEAAMSQSSGCSESCTDTEMEIEDPDSCSFPSESGTPVMVEALEEEPVPALLPVEEPEEVAEVAEPVPVPVPVPVPAEEAVVVEEVVEEVPPPPAEVTLEVVYAAQVASLRNMGFTVDDAMLASLEAHEGDLVKLINSML
eukprot:TRINITY_DN14809_c0_g2_i5.p1 TRINITY_DN14809_c0_g2~~TRINITY_DN14809_c0_g2_i5.p1  ORF type:complete len:350 (+),score=148.43 TRINITY_DN14809_c0_g2_i5:153-1052(+)